MRVLVVDDEAPARARLTRLVAELGGCLCVGEADNGINALARVQELTPDVVLLDVRMPLMDGLETARHLATLETPPAIIFTTAYDEYALQAFDAHAVAYLLKPVRSERLADAMEHAARPTRAQLESMRRPEARLHLSATVGGRLEVVPVQSVRCLVAEQKYVTARHELGELVLDETLKSLEVEFADQFIRIHRNALVAVDHVERLEAGDTGAQVYLRGDAEPLDVSRRHLADVKRRLKGHRA